MEHVEHVMCAVCVCRNTRWGGGVGKGAITFMDTVNAYECAEEERGCYIIGFVLN